MDEHYLIASPGLLGIRTNIADFQCSFATAAPPASRQEYDRCQVRLRVSVEKRLAGPVSPELGKYHYFRGAPGDDSIYYARPFMFGAMLRLHAHQLLGCEPEITINETYRRFVHHRFMNVHSLGYIITDLAALLLLHHGLAPLHCSAFQLGDATAVIVAPPNTGKTLSTMTACLEHGARFIAEDLAITDGENVYSVPWTSTFRHYSHLERNPISRWQAAVSKVFPPIELFQWRKTHPVTRFIKPNQHVHSAAPTHLLVLEQGDTAVESLTVDEAVRKLENLNRYEFNYHRAPLLVAHEFFNPGVDLLGAVDTERMLLRRLATEATERLVVRTRDATQYAALIVDRLGKRQLEPTSRLAVA